MNRILLLFFFLLCYYNVFAQINRQNSYSVLLFNITYAFEIPAADLSKRFGTNFSLGGGIDILTEKNNFIFGIKGHNLFGKNVKEDALASIRDQDGFIIGSDGSTTGSYANIVLRQRGFFAGGHVGKLFVTSKKRQRAGIKATLGLGLLQHKFRIQDESNNTPQITGDYAKGYDQLTNGLAIDQFIGYQYLSRDRNINFFAGIELIEAFTQNRRAINFATQSTDATKRFDFIWGFRIGWSLPLYIGEKAEDIIYGSLANTVF